MFGCNLRVQSHQLEQCNVLLEAILLSQWNSSAVICTTVNEHRLCLILGLDFGRAKNSVAYNYVVQIQLLFALAQLEQRVQTVYFRLLKVGTAIRQEDKWQAGGVLGGDWPKNHSH